MTTSIFRFIDRNNLQQLDQWAQTATPFDLDRALSYAVFKDNTDLHLVMSLLRKGAYANAMGWTPGRRGGPFVDLREIDRQDTRPQWSLIRDQPRDVQRVVHVAYMKNRLVMVLALLRYGADVKTLYKDVRTRLGNSSIISDAALNRKNKAMLWLLIENVSNWKGLFNEYGHTLLYQLIKHNRQRLYEVTYLIEKGADVNAQSGTISVRMPVFLFTNVHACLGRNLPMLKRLMRHEVDINVFEKGGSPLRVAISQYARAPASRKQHHRDFVETLLGYNVDFVFHDYHNPTRMDPFEPVPNELIDIVARYRREQSVEYIESDEFQDIQGADEWGKTALHRAVENGQYLQAKSLIAYGASYDVTDQWGYTAHQRAMQRYEYYSNILAHRFSSVAMPRRLIEQKTNECKRIVNMLVRVINRYSGNVAAF